jgi:hypothetical protein
MSKTSVEGYLMRRSMKLTEGGFKTHFYRFDPTSSTFGYKNGSKADTYLKIHKKGDLIGYRDNPELVVEIYKFKFSILTTEKTYTLFTDNPVDYIKWLKVLSAYFTGSVDSLLYGTFKLGDNLVEQKFLNSYNGQCYEGNKQSIYEDEELIDDYSTAIGYWSIDKQVYQSVNVEATPGDIDKSDLIERANLHSQYETEFCVFDFLSDKIESYYEEFGTTPSEGGGEKTTGGDI